MTERTTISRAVADLRIRRAANDLDAVKNGIEALRTLDPEHPEIDLATAVLLDARGEAVAAMAARLRGYDRLAASTGDPIARSLGANLLARALHAKDGYAILRPAALTSSDPALLAAFLTAACNHGHFDEGMATINRLRDLTGDGYRDAEDVVDLGRRIEALPVIESGRVVVRQPPDYERGSLHHSVVTQALIGAAERHGCLTESFARPLAEVLDACGVYTEAAVRGALRHLLALGCDSCAEAFLDVAADRLTVAAATEILDHAIDSAVGRDETDAALRYGRRFDDLTGCGQGPLYRLSSHAGVSARRRSAWAACLRTLTRDDAPVEDPASALSRPFPAEVPAYRSDDRIDVFLKCVKRPFDIHPFVAFWMECFGDSSRYRLRLLDDTGLDLAEHYKQYPIVDSCSLRSGPNEARALFSQARRPLDMLGWESIANLTPFAQTTTRWFWNIDADDIRPLLGARTTIDDVRRKLRDVEDFAADNGLMAMSYDLWASVHWLLDHGYHWTFGICLCRSDPALLGRMLASVAGCDIPAFRINLDHVFSRFSDGQLGNDSYTRYFSSFIFDRIPVLQKDPEGRELYHRQEYLLKYLAFDPDMARHVRARLHAKTLVV